MRIGRLIGLGAGALACAPAQAETLPVEGIYAAGTDAPSRARTIAIAGFAGRGGERVAFAIDSVLRDAVIEGRPWFAVTFSASRFGDNYRYDREADPAAARGGTEAVMRGIADVEVRDADAPAKNVEECAERNLGGACTKKKTVSIPCKDRHVTLRPEVRLVAQAGELLYARSETLTASRRFCEDDKSTPSFDSMIAELADRFALIVRFDVAPTYRAEDIRVLESRGGIAKADHAAFRDALRLTKTDVIAACDAFAALQANNPRDITVMFNIGLCHESAGDLDAAGQVYNDVLAISPRKLEPQQGLDRIASRLRAERQLVLHGYPAAR